MCRRRSCRTTATAAATVTTAAAAIFSEYENCHFLKLFGSGYLKK
jgi:hypothetical protein